MSANATVQEVLDLTRHHHISGVPVIDDDKLAGIVTHRDLRFETRFDAPVSKVMTGRDKLVTVKEGASRDEVKALLHEHRIEKVLVVDEDFNLRGLVTVKDIQKSTIFATSSRRSGGTRMATKLLAPTTFGRTTAPTRESTPGSGPWMSVLLSR